MQLIDPEDPRLPNVQIAAAIRAAILTGEFQPGERLPSGDALAEQFGVARPTVMHAVRKLADEGFVRTVAGGGIYVRDQASQPVPEGTEHPLAGAAKFLFEAGHLKNTPRTGWLLLGIPQPESVAEHSYRVGIAGIILAAASGADIGRTAALALLHDFHETRIGDLPSVGRAYVSTAEPGAVTAHQTTGMPADMAKVIQELTDEYEAGETDEARLAKDADKIEMLCQALEYAKQGFDTSGWRDNSVAALRTDAGQQLAQAIGAADPHQWWRAFNDSYAQLRASTRGHS